MGAGLALSLGMGAFSAIAGGLKGPNRQRNTVTTSPMGAFEKQMRALQSRQMSSMESMVNAGPGQQDVAGAASANRDLASLFGQLAQSGGMPNQQQMGQAQSVASQLFAPQQEALRQSFEFQGQAANRQAALMGRQGNDPILQARLAQDQTRQSAMLQAQMGSQAQSIAMSLPHMQAQFASQRAATMDGLAGQAMSNRQNLLSMGNTLSEQDRNFRLQTATREMVQPLSAGDRFGNAASGLMSGMGAGASLFGSLSRATQPAPQLGGFGRMQQQEPMYGPHTMHGPAMPGGQMFGQMPQMHPGTNFPLPNRRGTGGASGGWW